MNENVSLRKILYIFLIFLTFGTLGFYFLGHQEFTLWQALYSTLIVLLSHFLHGTEDPIIPYEHGVHLSDIIPNAVLVTLEGAGHELHYNDWDKIINAISKCASSL